MLCLHKSLRPPRRLLKLSIWSPNFKATNSNSTSNASQSSNDKINFNSYTPNSIEIHPHKVEVWEHWKNGKRNPAYNCSLFNCTCWRNGKRKTSGHGLENVNTCESSHIHQQIWKSTNVKNVKMFVWIPISGDDFASWFVWQLHNFCWWRIINLQHSKCLLRFVIKGGHLSKSIFDIWCQIYLDIFLIFLHWTHHQLYDNESSPISKPW